MLGNLRETAVFLVLTLWAASMAFVSATLMIGHWLALPTPKVGSHQPFDVVSIPSDNSKGKVLHFVDLECRCSQRILNHLQKRGPLEEVEEVVVIVGKPNADCEFFGGSKFTLDWVTPEEMKIKYGVESSPVLVVLDNKGIVRYSGGYTTRKQGFFIQDVSLIRRTLAGELVQPLPLFGCGVSKELQSITDPLGLKKKLSR